MEATSHEAFSTAAIRPKERLDYWRDAVTRNLNGIRCRNNDELPFSGDLRATSGGEHTVASLKGGRHRAIRTEEARRTLGDDFYVLFFQKTGQMGVSFNDEELLIGPKEFYFYDPRINHQLIFEEAFDHVAIRVPRAKVKSRWRSLAGRGSFKHSSSGDALSKLIGANIEILAARSNALRTNELELAIDTIFELFDANVRERSADADNHSLHSNGLLLRATKLIEHNLLDERLGPEHIAKHLGISRRSLDQQFQKHGTTVGQTIVRTRLKKCARDLQADEYSAESVAQIAYSWGFKNSSHFAKAFKQEFGLSPTAFRKQKTSISRNMPLTQH